MLIQNTYNHKGATSGNPTIINPEEYRLNQEQIDAYFQVVYTDTPLDWICDLTTIPSNVIMRSGKITYNLGLIESDLKEGSEYNDEFVPSQNAVQYGEICINGSLTGATKFTGERINEIGKSGFDREQKDLDMKRTIDLKERLFNYAVTMINIKTPPSNRGNKAGSLHDMKLGSMSQPLNINPDNYVYSITKQRSVLKNTVSESDNTFIMLPGALWDVMLSSKQTKDSLKFLNDTITANNNIIQTKLSGNPTIIVTDRMPTCRISKSQVAYMIVAGKKKSFLGGYNFIFKDLVPGEKFWGYLARCKAVYGGGIPNPKLFSVGFFVIDYSAFGVV